MEQIRLAFVDLETTGLKVESGDKITEIGICLYDLDSEGNFVHRGSKNLLINPERNIPDKIVELTGITNKMVKDKPVFAKVAPALVNILKKCDVLVAHNIDFDAPFLATQLYQETRADLSNLDLFCTMENGLFATPLGKKPNLGELAWSLNVDYDAEAAHRALYDTEVMAQCFIKAYSKGYIRNDMLGRKVSDKFQEIRRPYISSVKLAS